MGDSASTASPESINVQRAQYVWEEYRYRHDLIWKLLFRMTAVAVLLAITPFTIKDLASESAEDWVKLLPAIALLLVAASAIVLRFRAGAVRVDQPHPTMSSQKEAIGRRTGVEPATNPGPASGRGAAVFGPWSARPRSPVRHGLRRRLVLWFEIGI